MNKNEALRKARGLEREIHKLSYDLNKAVREASEAGASWAEIGHELGLSKQTAYNRYGKEKSVGETIKESNAESKKAHEKDAAETRKIMAERAAKTTNKPSKTADGGAPARRSTAKATSTNGAFRRLHTIPIPDETAQPGIGKGMGPHQCPACGDTNHKTEHNDLAAFTAECVPTQYDPAKIAYLMWTTNGQSK